MTTCKTKDVSAKLRKKGFVRNDDADHCQYFLYADGVKTKIRTKMSHGEREIGDALIQKMSKQLKLDKREFLDLVECRLDGETYLQMMRERGEVGSQKNN